VDDNARGPGEEVGDDEADALARAGGGEDEGVLWALVTEIPGATGRGPEAKEEPRACGKETRGADVLGICPERRAVDVRLDAEAASGAEED